MENYKVILDEAKLREFIDWLPNLEINQTFYVCFFSRSKYLTKDSKYHIKHIRSDKAQLKRFLTDKRRMYNKIQQLELPIDTYLQFTKDGEIPIPQETLALYIYPNPRDIVSATYELINKSVKLLQTQAKNYNLVQEAFSAVQKSKTRKYVTFDIDNKDVDLSILHNIIPEFNRFHKIIETRGGYHILINSSQAETYRKALGMKSSWYKEIQEEYKVDITGDVMSPIPGTYQGGFCPRFINI